MEEREHRSITGVLVVVGAIALYIVPFVVLSIDAHTSRVLVTRIPEWILEILETIYWPLIQLVEFLFFS